VAQAGDVVELETTTTVDQRQLGMSSGLLRMIRPPATMHVRADSAAQGKRSPRPSEVVGSVSETAGSRRRLIFAALLLVLFIASLDQTIVF
jgi:hypothetical protein